MLSRHSMETLNCAPEGASARSRSPSRSPEVAPQHPSTPPIRITESEELVITPDMVPHVDSSCAGCLAPSRRLKHTCTKAKHTGKRHALPSVVARHTKRSGRAPALALLVPEGALIEGASLAIDRGSDVSVCTWEMHVPSPAPPHPSSSEEPPPPTRPPSPVPTPTLEQREATEVDGDVVLAEEHDTSDVRDTHVANDVVDGLDPAPSASQDEDLPPPLPSLLPSAVENEHLFVPPEGSFVCVALRDGVLPPELHVFTSIGGCIVVTRTEALGLPVEARNNEPSWSCGTCRRGPYSQARALACVHCLSCAPMAEDALRRLKEKRRHDGCARPRSPSHGATARCIT